MSSDFLLKEVKAPKLLDQMVVIHDDPLNEKEIQNFIAKQQSTFIEIAKAQPVLKIWLIPSADKPAKDKKDQGKSIYIVSKHYHFIADGLSILQMFSLMQDGGTEVS